MGDTAGLLCAGRMDGGDRSRGARPGCWGPHSTSVGVDVPGPTIRTTPAGGRPCVCNHSGRRASEPGLAALGGKLVESLYICTTIS